MKKWVLTAAIMGLAASAPAFADGMDNAIGNTVRIIVNDAGEGFDVYFEADGSYSDSLGRNGATWAYGDELCVTPAAESGAETACGPWNADLAAGGSWETDGWSDDGGSITITILEGRGHEAPTPPTPPAE
ncbi:hypothetical protein [Hyphobacterium sp.]|uniref:hypothetical protein n=1 Tax=Hyphobacterium sp. TaxID=2004662 RepID=UPI003B518E5F